MKHLFTPWRMEYILKAKQPGCVFCAMLEEKDDAASLIVRRGERSFLVLNKYPYNNGHFMVVPYRHVDTLEELEPEELAEMMSLTTLGMRALRHTLRPEGFNFGANVGEVAGAGVKDHVHMHVVPRWSGDTNYMSVLSETRVIPQSLADTYKQLKEALDALIGQ
ncbi:MAG: HIT domain-containing protein [Anaerolineae bacterium]|nr:HIT domain-containing protein [Anaerolineae bacterium]